MFLEYLYVLKFVLVSGLVALILFFFSILTVYQKPDIEKVSAYECGFNPYGDARSKFNVKFYLVGILFIIFDLEITFLFPWILSWITISVLGKSVMYFFVILLTVGFIVELKLGAVDLDTSFLNVGQLKNYILTLYIYIIYNVKI